MRFLPALLVPALVLLGSSRPPLAPQAEAAQEVASADELASWRAALERDRRLAWTARTEELALAALDSGHLTESERAAALYAVGAGGGIEGRDRLQTAAREGSAPERRAALLGLGEVGIGVESQLTDAAADPEVAEAALLALLRTDRVSARRRAQEIAETAGGELAAAFPELVLFLADPASSRPSSATRALLDLRWKAARAYGLVDGEAWAVRLGRRLLERDDFLDEVVLRAAAELGRPGVNDHLLVTLLERGGPAAVRAAVRAMPSELETLVEHELWKPSADDWRVVVDEIEQEGAPQASAALLQRTASIEALRLRSIVLLARGGVTTGVERLRDEWPLLAAKDRVLVCEAWGASGLDDALGWLRGVDEPKEPEVRAALWVARARLSDTEASGHVAAVLADPSAEEHESFVLACARTAYDRAIAPLLTDAVAGLEDPLRLRAAVALCEAGRVTPLDYLRPVIGDDLPEGELGLEVLHAIAVRGTVEDRFRAARLFPFERDDELPPDVNAVLVRLMLQDRDIRALPVLRNALWRDPQDRSLLAGALIVDIGGNYSLREEIVRRPTDANVRDYRRVGFAVGEWGGIEAMRALAAHPRIHPGDPVLEGALLGALASRTR